MNLSWIQCVSCLRGLQNAPLHRSPHTFFIAVHTLPINEDGDKNRGGMDTDAEFNNSWWKRVKYYAQLAIQRVESVKELLNTLTSDEQWGVILEFEDVDPDKFAQLVTDAPDWVEWIA